MYAHGGRVGGCSGAIHGHGDGGVVVFEADELVLPEFPRPGISIAAVVGRQCDCCDLPWPHVPALQPFGEAHVDPLDILGEDVCAGAEADGEELGLQLAHALA